MQTTSFDLETANSPCDQVATAAGATARCVQSDAGEVLEVRRADGQLLFQYDATRQRTVLCIPDGDLSLLAPNGKVEVAGGEGVHLHSGSAVTVDGSAVALRARSSRSSSQLTVADQSIDAAAARIGVVAERGAVEIGDLDFRGEVLRTTVQQVRSVIGKLDSVVTRLRERLQDVDRRVAGTQRVAAQRMRTRVDGSYVLHSESTTVQSDKDVKLDGRQILLG